jgi:hypothetical protein
MILLEKFTVEHAAGTRHVELFHGDLSRIPREEAVDVLVISAYPDDYTPTPGSLIGALHREGISVRELAQRKAVDLRHAFSCWLSEDLGASFDQVGFRRVLCFEPLIRGAPEAVVGEIFQSLMPFVHGSPPINTLAMPLVASGDQGVPVDAILTPLLEAATRWLGLGLPIERLKIVERSEPKAHELAARLAAFARDLPTANRQTRKSYSYDVFISYSHGNADAADFLVAQLRTLKPDIRIFLDRHDIDLGHSWQHRIFESIDSCDKVVAVYSPSYLQSRMCKEEFSIALHRHRESEEGVLLPIYLSSTDLPTYMKLLQYRDCRESDRVKLTLACQDIVRHLGGSQGVTAPS